MVIKSVKLVDKEVSGVKEVVIAVIDMDRGVCAVNEASNADREAGIRVLRDKRKSALTDPSMAAKEALMTSIRDSREFKSSVIVSRSAAAAVKPTKEPTPLATAAPIVTT